MTWNEVYEAYEDSTSWRNFVPSPKTKVDKENTKKDEEKEWNQKCRNIREIINFMFFTMNIQSFTLFCTYDTRSIIVNLIISYSVTI